VAGRLEAICTSERKGIPKTARPAARLLAAHGIQGDAHAGPGHRQVSILGRADIEAFRRTGGLAVEPGAFAENLIIDGLELSALGLGSRLRIGASAEISITQLGKRCHQRCAIFHRTGDCIMPRLGLFARVVEDGDIVVGAPVEIRAEVGRATFQAVVLTVSDRCAAGSARYTAGPAVA